MPARGLSKIMQMLSSSCTCQFCLWEMRERETPATWVRRYPASEVRILIPSTTLTRFLDRFELLSDFYHYVVAVMRRR